MAIILAAEELHDARTLKMTRRGMEGSRTYKVNTGDVGIALFGNALGPTPGLPTIGEPWDLVKAPYLVVVEIEPEREGGQNTDALNRTGGWTRVRVRYSTIISGSLPPAAGITFTKLRPTTGQVNSLFGINPATGMRIPDAPQIGNGSGATQDVGAVDYEVWRPLSPSEFEALDHVLLVSLHTLQGLNDAQVTLPAFLQSDTRHTFAKGQLRFHGYEIDDPDPSNYRYLRMTLLARTTHEVRWAKEGPDGKATGDELAAFQYKYMSFNGLWD